MSKTITLANRSIGPIGYGLMGLTWRAEHLLPSQTQAFEAMKAALESGANFWNAGEIYGTPERNSMHLLNEYFTKYPEDAEKVVLSVKGGLKRDAMQFDGTEAGMRASIDNCLKILDGKKSIDIFESARVDPNVPIEETIRGLAKCVEEGKIGAIGLSEVKAETIRRAAAVHRIASVEVEVSLWTTNILHNGVGEACKELGIPIVGYSPLSRGALTGQFPKSFDELPDHLKHFPRFEDQVLQSNMRLTQEAEKIAQNKHCTAAQVAIAWVSALSGRKGLGIVIPIPGATTKARVKENSTIVSLSEEEMDEIDKILQKNQIVGDRYGGPVAKLSDG